MGDHPLTTEPVGKSADGSEVWSTNLNSSIAVFDNDIGDSRLAFDGTTYAAYYTVYGISGMYAEHNGDRERALEFYRRYLALDDNPPPTAVEHIRNLESAAR